MTTLRHPLTSFRNDWTDLDRVGRMLLVVCMPVAGVGGFAAGLYAAVMVTSHWPW